MGNVPLLLDTGAFVALVDRSETMHSRCVAVFESWEGPIITTEAVLTETLYLVGPSWHAQRTCLEFFLRDVFTLVPLSSAILQRITALMEKYQDIPMDFADATLVALGEALDISNVFTLDWKGFSAYRLHGRKPFTILPAY